MDKRVDGRQDSEASGLPEAQRRGRAGALYIHVPFCLRKCRYCNFFSLADRGDLTGGYLQALIAELHCKATWLAEPLASVFVGGGTPTALECELLKVLLEAVRPYVNRSTEFSVEANPGTVGAGTVDLLSRAGVNRVNLGVQSFDAGELATLGRTHTTKQVRSAWGALRHGGIATVGMDLIYGISGQTLDSWGSSLSQALELGPDHLSCYALTLEEHTPLDDDVRAGRLAAADESLQKECYYAAIDRAAGAGLEHYEISNFASPGRQCKHNLTYWHNLPYVGLGPAAASYLDGVRQTNRPGIEAYIRTASAGEAPPCDAEKLSGRAEMAETAMLALRLVEGLSRGEFTARFGCDVADIFPKTIGRYSDQGALILTENQLRLAKWAMFVSNTVLADLLAEA
ncbi:MAG: radical SAM family heme chaperone HemW [Phycisphaerae bacterium]|jgi:oxygen-independent coproporphyrinogen-3 oxidase|nr:radical SAM family heme chaperone HemW [Phycisphaerae bacterium]